ncbi:hypothetical protein EVAR_17539_1 [Eumeta japonica]|uniref:Uncharacterized protein n=1 Tax=Eumeta variegata TaxID=151549 RepID=A0A4C1WR68_EUMVA|nr:hypothetical protein EVAR_17539_1 [Eumeta japonica]
MRGVVEQSGASAQASSEAELSADDEANNIIKYNFPKPPSSLPPLFVNGAPPVARRPPPAPHNERMT